METRSERIPVVIQKWEMRFQRKSTLISLMSSELRSLPHDL